MDTVIPIKGVKLKNLRIIPHPKGDILQVAKASEVNMTQFKEIYITIIKHNEIKGWKLHKRMMCNFVVPMGEVKFVLTKDKKSFFEIILSRKNYKLLSVPPGIWFAFQGLGEGENFVINLATLEHDPEESISIELNEIDYFGKI